MTQREIGFLLMGIGMGLGAVVTLYTISVIIFRS